jgi:hypothetical protein
MSSPPVTMEQEWREIESAPRDGTVIDLTWMEDGCPQEIWPMFWSDLARNAMFGERRGYWVIPGGGITWNPEGDGGPTHWRSRPSFPSHPEQ